MKEITNNKLTDANIKFNATDRYKKIYNYFFKIISLILVFHICFLNIQSSAKNELKTNMENVNTECEAVIIYDITTGEILYSKNI